jgi:ATP-dependent protease ClpP protease subunit
MRTWLSGAVMMVALLLAPASFAAKFFYSSTNPYGKRVADNQYAFLVMSGDIVIGDYDRLLSLISINPNEFLARNTMIMASNGGDVAEALKIATLVNATLTTAWVSPVYGQCVSACFLIFVSANHRIAERAELLGIHRPYLESTRMATLSPPDARSAETGILQVTRKYLQEKEVPGYLIEEMFRRASNEVYWLSIADIEQVGDYSSWLHQYTVAKCGMRSGETREYYDKVVACEAAALGPTAKKALYRAMEEEASTKGHSKDLEELRSNVSYLKMLEDMYSKQEAQEARCIKEGPSCATYDESVCLHNHHDFSQCAGPEAPH